MIHLQRSSLIFLTAFVLQLSPSLAAENRQVSEFLSHINELLANTTDRALRITADVYRRLGDQMPPDLRSATEDLRRDYIEEVEEVIQSNASYTRKRELFARYRHNNGAIERLRKELLTSAAPAVEGSTQYEYELISNEFYANGTNRTAFDNLYLDFMRAFERASQRLWRELSERTVEESQDMLEILDEISQEKELRVKDKLYDEFIEAYLLPGRQEGEGLDQCLEEGGSDLTVIEEVEIK